MILNNIGDGNNATVRACVHSDSILESPYSDADRILRNSRGSGRSERESNPDINDLGLDDETANDGFGAGLKGGGNGGGGGGGGDGGGGGSASTSPRNGDGGLMLAADAEKLAAKIIKKASVTNVRSKISSTTPASSCKP